jgi:hypothetical protein
LPLSDEQVMDCAIAGRVAIAIHAMTPKTKTRKPRIRIRNPSRPESYTRKVFCEAMRVVNAMES